MRSSFFRCALVGLGVLLCGAAPPRAPAADLVTLYLRGVEFDPTFQAARAERELADEALRESRAGVRPLLSLNASDAKVFQNIRSSETPLFTPGRTDFFVQDFSISLTQPLFRSDALHRIPGARAGVKRGEAELAAAEQDLMFRVAEAVFNYLAAQDDVELSTAEREAIRRQFEETEQKLGSGLATITDVHEAKGRLAVAQAEEIDARDRLEEGRQAIAEITGDTPHEVKILSAGLPLVQPDSPEVDAWLQRALFQNPRVLALTAALDVSREETKVQRGGYLPTLDFVASYDNNDAGGSIYGGGNEIANQQYALRLAIPLYDGGRTAALVGAATLRQAIAEQALEREKRSVDRQTRAAFQGVVSGVARVEALASSVFSREAAVVAKEEGWRAGLNTGLEVLDSRRDLFRSRRDHARARYLYVLNSLKLKQAAGILSVRDLEEINAYLQ